MLYQYVLHLKFSALYHLNEKKKKAILRLIPNSKEKDYILILASVWNWRRHIEEGFLCGCRIFFTLSIKNLH